ncbi:hypothetical protein [Shewanella algae]|uniref:hypothetical protein n=1 Tax=Shewanella algae TaxID=38313 RepID=UPI0031F4922C
MSSINVVATILDVKQDVERDADYETAIDVNENEYTTRCFLVSLFGQCFVLGHEITVTRGFSMLPEDNYCSHRRPEADSYNSVISVLNSSALSLIPQSELKKIVSADKSDVEISISWDIVYKFLQERHNDRVSIRISLEEIAQRQWMPINRTNNDDSLDKDEALFYKICGYDSKFLSLYARCFPADAIREFGINLDCQ